MTEKVIYRNNTDKRKHIGAVTIPPGEAREVDKALLDDGTKQDKPFDVQLFLRGNAKSIIGAIPALDDKQLEAVYLAEDDDGSPRKTVMSALKDELKIRAAKLERDALYAEFRALSVDELQQALLVDDLDGERQSIIQDVLSERQEKESL